MSSSGGSRSRNGCYTCRIRKKKCDEQRPRCGSCALRNLECYGYDSSPPDWMQGKTNWKEVMATEEARQLQSIAESQYKTRRRCAQNSGELTSRRSGPSSSAPRPEPIWWDSGLCSSLPSQKTPRREDARLLKLYMDFIFPVQFTFCPLTTPADQRWLISGLCGNTARYQGALSVSACFDASMKETARIDGIGLNVEVAQRKDMAVRGLQTLVTRFHEQRMVPREMIGMAIQMMEVMHQLLSLEVFSMLEGTWHVHHRATLTLLEAIHNYNYSKTEATSHSSPLEMALLDFSCPDTQRTLEFHVTTVIWVDVIANATFGSPDLADSRPFEYIPYLRNNSIKTQGIMGCHSSVMASIAEITCLSDWKRSQIQSKSLNTEELSVRAAVLSSCLLRQTQEIEQQSVIEMSHLEAQSRLVTLQFALAAQAYLHVVVHGIDTNDPQVVDMVHRSLQMLEALPSGFIIRANWAFTIIGCLANEALHDQFRALVMNLIAQKAPLGMTWKGLMVMEECWRLRQQRPELKADCDWRMATKSLGNRILLV